MNIPNALTTARVILSVVAAVLVCTGCKYALFAAFVIFLVAGSTDWLDGYFARKLNVVTNLGKFMDALCDKIMVIGFFMVLLGLQFYGSYMKLAIFCAFFASAREFFVSGIRMMAAKNGIVLAAETLGKYKAALQMYSIGAILCAKTMEVDFGASGHWFYAFAFYSGIITLVFSTIISIISGVNYGVKYRELWKN